MTWRRLIAGAAAGLVLSASAVAVMSSAAHAETVPTATSCSAEGTTLPGPTTVTFTVPTVIDQNTKVKIQLSSSFKNSTGISIVDLNTFSMPKATPVALSAGDLGGVANGATKTVTMTGTWTPKAAGKQAITAANWTFNAVVNLGSGNLTIPVTCTFTKTAPSITRTVLAPTLALSAAAVRPKGTVTASGANWVPSSSGTVSLCASAAATAKCSVIGTAKTSSAGKLTGSGIVPATTAAGSREIKVKVGADTKEAALYVLGARTISLSATTVKVGSKVTVKGSGWDPKAKVKIQPLNKAGKAVGKAIIVTASATGTFSVAITLTSTSITEISAAENANARLAAKPVKITVKAR